MILVAEVVEPSSYGFYYLATGLLGTGFVTMIVAIFVYFWRTQASHSKSMQDLVVDNALMKKDIDQIAKNIVEIKAAVKESSSHSPAAVQQAVMDLVEKLKAVNIIN